MGGPILTGAGAAYLPSESNCFPNMFLIRFISLFIEGNAVMYLSHGASEVGFPTGLGNVVADHESYHCKISITL